MTARRTNAIVIEEDHRTRIFVGNLEIELNKDPQQDGPLGVESLGGRDPGVAFYRHDGVLMNVEDGRFKHSTGESIGHAKMRGYTVDSILDEVNDK